MNKFKFATIFASAAALALSPAHVAAQAGGNPVSMGMNLEHVTEGGMEGGKVTAMLPGLTGEILGFKVGDIIIEAGGKPITPEVLREYMKDKKGGDQLIFKVKREGQIIELKGKAVSAP